MEFQKNVDTQIYTCSVDFKDIIELINFIIKKYINEHKTLSLNLNLSDGSTLYLNSLTDTEELESLKNKKITLLRLNYDDVFILTLSKNSNLLYDSKSEIGHFLYSYAIKQLNLNVNSIVIRTFCNVYFFNFIFLMAVMSLVYNALSFNNIFLLIINLALALSVIIIFLLYTNVVEIIMNNKKDFFITRNKDSIIISFLSLVTGFILGKYF